jgi:SNF2 family DNA or RNA helicase
VEKVEVEKVEVEKVEVEKVEIEEEKVEEEEVEVKKRGKKKLVVPSKTFVPEMNEKIKNIKIGKHTISERIPKQEKTIIKTSPYYMNNRRIFIQKLREMFKDYSKELEQNADISCAKKQKEEVTIMTHQKIVRDYMNLYTPYRGLLLYHALGSGKTATSIAIAEGMKSAKSIMVLTPASLKMNFFSEIKRYGDLLYRKNQYWEFISVEGKPEYIDILENVLSLPRETFIKNRGAWMIDVTKPPNFSELNSVDQESIDDQLNQMIRAKYIDINYNGLTKNKMSAITSDYTLNPFDDKVVIIDEAHNFVSRIVNKIKQPSSISYKLYDYLMKAKNARIVLLTGTPIINYPNEIGILFNILRGSIKTWSFPVTVKTGDKVNKEQILKIFVTLKFLRTSITAKLHS